MRNVYLLTFATMLAILSACTKDDDVTVTLDETTINLKTAGELSIQLIDDNATPIANQRLFLYSESSELADATTDQTGTVHFGKFNPGYYTVYGKEIVINGIPYTINKTVQVVVSEKVSITINPTTFSGEVTFKMYQQVPISKTEYSTRTKLNTGTVGLLPVSATFEGFEELKTKIIKSATLDASSNIVSFTKVPIGIYYVVVYTDATHYTIGNSSIYSNEQTYNITKDCDLNAEITIAAQSLFDYTGSVAINATELLPYGSSSSSFAKQALTYGKIALIPGYYNDYTAYSFDYLITKNVAEQTVSGTNNPVSFQNVPIGTYSVLFYTDSEHFIFGRSNESSYYNSYESFFVAPNSELNMTVFALGTQLKDYSFDNTYSVITYNYESSSWLPTENTKIYIINYSDYGNLYYGDRNNETLLKSIALASGTTDSQGDVTISTKAYTEVVIVAIHTNGNINTYSQTFYTQSSKTFQFYP